MNIFTKHIPVALRPTMRPHNNPHNRKYILMNQRPVFTRIWSSVKNRLGWALVVMLMGLCSPFYALYLLITGNVTGTADPLESFLEKWITLKKLDGWYFAEPKGMKDSLRLDAVTAISRKETYFLQFDHPLTHRDTALGFTAEGVAACYEFVPQEGDSAPVLRFVSELPSFRNEEELSAVLEEILQEEA